MFSTAVALEMRCELADAPTGEPNNGAAFRAHFAALGTSLQHWNATIDRTHAAPHALWRRLANSAREKGITEPPFMVGALIDHLATWTLERSRRWELGIQHETLLQHFNDRIGGEKYVSVYMMGRRVATLPGGSQPDVQRRLEATDSLVKALFDDARSCKEAKHVGDTRDAMLALKQRLLDALAHRSTIAAIAFAPECPRCQLSARSAVACDPVRSAAAGSA